MNLNRDILQHLPIALRIELDENLQRKDLTQTELAIQQERILEVLRDRAHPGARTDLTRLTCGKVLPQVRATERATATVARAYGESRTQVEKRLAVVKAAREQPERFAKLAEDMDRTGRVDGPHKRLKVMRQAAAIREEPPPYPAKGPYRVIAADPPWSYDMRVEDASHRSAHSYPSMSIEEICAEAPKVQAIAHEDCVLWLWTTNGHIRQAFNVLDAWGFEQKTILTWVKDRMGTGDWLRGQTEHCLMAVRGKPVVELTNQTTVLHGPLRANSQKPDEFYQFVERLCPAPHYADLFSRNQRNRWDAHGDEVKEAGTSNRLRPRHL